MADACTRSRGASPVLGALAETGLDGSAATGLVAGAGEAVCASNMENPLSNAAVAKPSLFREVAIVMMQKRECAMG